MDTAQIHWNHSKTASYPVSYTTLHDNMAIYNQLNYVTNTVTSSSNGETWCAFKHFNGNLFTYIKYQHSENHSPSRYLKMQNPLHRKHKSVSERSKCSQQLVYTRLHHESIQADAVKPMTLKLPWWSRPVMLEYTYSSGYCTAGSNSHTPFWWSLKSCCII